MGSIENIPTLNSEEKKIPRITEEEWIEYSGGKENDEKFKAWKQKTGIKFDENGIAEIKVGDSVIKTREEDFGTIIEEPDAIIEKASV